MMILGIDPGSSGAFALLGKEDLIVEPMPVKDGYFDVQELNRLLRHYADQVTYCYLEQAQIRSMQAGQFSFARNFGVIEGMLACLGIKYMVVRANEWSAEFDHKVTEKNLKKRKKLIKIARRGIAQSLYPGIDLKRTPNCKFQDEGIVDALLIATWGWRKHQTMNQLRGIR